MASTNKMQVVRLYLDGRPVGLALAQDGHLIPGQTVTELRTVAGGAPELVVTFSLSQLQGTQADCLAFPELHISQKDEDKSHE